MNHAALDEMLLKLKEKNKKNQFFESIFESIKKRSEKDACGEYFRISERYLNLSLEEKKKMVNLGIVWRKAIEQKRKNLKILFYSLNEFKRQNGLTSFDVPACCKHKLSLE